MRQNRYFRIKFNRCSETANAIFKARRHLKQVIRKYPISEVDLITLKKAKFDMEKLNWTIRVVNIAGNSLEAGVKKIPQKYLQIIQTVTQNGFATCQPFNTMLC